MGKTINLPITCKEVQLGIFAIFIAMAIWGTMNFENAGVNDPLVFIAVIIGWVGIIIIGILWLVTYENEIGNALPNFKCKCDKDG